MSQIDSAFAALGKLKFWFATQEGTSLVLSHIPEIISLRWTYFKDNWQYIKTQMLDNVDAYIDPNLLKSQIEAMDYLISVQQSSISDKLNPFSDTSTIANFYAIWDTVKISSIPLTRAEEAIIDDKVTQIARLTKTNFIDIRHALTDGRDEVADLTATSDNTYNEVFMRSSVKSLRAIKLSDIEIMYLMQNGIQACDYIIANSGFSPMSYIDPFALARTNAKNPELQIPSYQSGTLIKMSFGESLESLAKKYLGSPDKWIDIAVANGLRPPYIDEVGIALPLTSNGSGTQINVAKLDTNGNPNKDKFYIGQPVFLQSNVEVFVNQRHVISIREVPISGELIIELNGDPNLSLYKVVDSANVRVYQPNTINSNFMIMIPDLNASTSPPSQETPFFLLSSAEDEKRAGVDMAVNDDYDLIFTPNGDVALSYGLANALQNMTFKLITEQGQLFRHPSYGLVNVAGTKIVDITQQKAIIVTSITNMVQSDSRYSGLNSLDVTSEGSTLRISLTVRLAGSGTLLPLNFTVNVG